MVVLLALLIFSFCLFPKDASGATTHETRLASIQKLAANPALAYKGVKIYKQPRGWGCVGYLRRQGYYVPMTRTGGAGSIPVSSTALPPEGEYVVIVTWEGPVGHVLLGTNINGQIIVRDEANFGKVGGKGRVVPLRMYKGYIVSPRRV